MSEATTIPHTLTLAELPAVKQPLADGQFGGVITLADGKPYVVVKLQDKPPKGQSKDAQMEWAKSLGARPATRAVIQLLISIFGSEMGDDIVWLEEDYERNPAYAWYCSLNYGSVLTSHRSAELGGVAVRLIPLTA